MQRCKYGLALLVLAGLVALLVIAVPPVGFPGHRVSLRVWIPIALSIVLATLAYAGNVIAGHRRGKNQAIERHATHRSASARSYSFGGFGLILALSGLLSACAVVKPTDDSVTLLAVNDIYRIEGINSGRVGGLARLRTLRANLEAERPGRVLLLHAGDVIFPSLLSRIYKGRQMIDVLNLLDGDPTAGRLDEKMVVVFGNHEFEKEHCDPNKEPVLQKRVFESDFYWLHSNIVLAGCPNDRPGLLGANLIQSRIIQVGSMRIGLFGLTIDSADQRFSFKFLDPSATAAALSADLRRRGADVVIALTHLNRETDREIYESLRARGGPDLIIGGHDHEHMHYPETEPRVFKADSDARTAWVIGLRRGADGKLQVTHELRELNEAVPPDPAVAERVARWLREHERTFCSEREYKSADCLSTVLGTAGTELVASEEKIRTTETSFGNWVADVMRGEFIKCRADAALINAGGLRLNHDLPAGTKVTRRHIEELVEYETRLRLAELSGEQLLAAMNNSISQPGSGRWLQISGVAFVYDKADKKVQKLFVKPPSGPPIDVTKNPKKKFLVVVSDYMTTGLEDGYKDILPQTKEACPAVESDLKKLVYEALQRGGSIAPKKEGRICETRDLGGGSCLAEAWSKESAR